MARLGLLVVLAFGLLLPSIARAEPQIPTLQKRVTDQASILNPSEQSRLEEALHAYEKETGHQFAFLSVPSLEGFPIEVYSMEVAEKWKLGDEKRDDGLILLVAKQDRKMRIEVGYGLEGAIPDALAAQIIRNQLAPAFRSGDFSAGINAAFATLMKAAEGESVRVGPAPEDEGSGSPLGGLIWFVLIVVFAIMTRGWGLLFLAPGFGGGRHGGGSFGGFRGGGGGFGGGGASGGW